MIRKCTITSNDNWIAKHVGYIELLLSASRIVEDDWCVVEYQAKAALVGLLSRPWSGPAMIVIGVAPFRCWTVEGFESLSGATANVDASLFCKVVECFFIPIDARVLPLDCVEFEPATFENFSISERYVSLQR